MQKSSIKVFVAIFQNLTIHGLYWGSYMKFDPKVLQDSMQELLEMLAKGSLHVPISHKFGLSEVINLFTLFI